MHQNETKAAKRILVTSKSILLITIPVSALTIFSIWFWGLGEHRTLFENSILSTSILSIAFFLFLTIGLYKGIKLKDDLGKITDKIKIDNIPDLSGMELSGDMLDADEGIAGIIFGIIAWLLFSIFLIVFIWFFSAIVWAMILAFAAMLYWIFFRALRLVFKNSNKCKGKLMSSMLYGLGYTVLYNFWIYGIMLTTHYLIK
ncbi:hypothetical protein [Lacibacter sediminis]|uniref:Uncharacterized protein n=1 Tax=Lacibacter sediminis TaxID=2760713 RepID=A0A7G5XC46_9BACT|nr:hypothetical protein [Lacibacter sediminis]QNA43049.1 hypothetical protein H4075_13245 [Lacibacter sediminis]